MNGNTLRHEVNKFLVWREVRRHRGNVTISDLARFTGLTEVTVVKCLAELKIVRHTIRPEENRHGLAVHVATDHYMHRNGAW